MKRKLNLLKIILINILLTFIFVMLITPVFAGSDEDYNFNGENGYRITIDDEASLLSSEEKDKLKEVMKEILPYGNAAFLSTDHNSYTTSYYAELNYKEMFGSNSGTLFLIDMDNREIYIYSNGNIYKTVTKTRANEITDNVYQYASRSQYYECAERAFLQISTILGGGSISTPMKYATSAAFAAGIVLLINFLIVYYQRKKPKELLHLTMGATQEYAVEGQEIVKNISSEMTKQTKSRHTESSGSGGFSGGGGGFSGGGGGFSGGGGGGGGGHGF